MADSNTPNQPGKDLTPEQAAKKKAKADAKAAKIAKAQEKAAKKTAAPADNAEAPKKEAPKKEIRLKKEYVNPTPPGEKKDMSTPMVDKYDPPVIEAAWYQWWEKQGFFNPDSQKDTKGTFVMVIPPPNVTGSLHLGHALTNSIQDCIVRWHRMNNIRTLWVPGTDHAGIATQAVVEKKLYREQKKTRHDFTRDAFVAEIWKWKQTYGNTILSQLRRIGSSLDWTRECFTMDDKLSVAVVEAFVQMHESGLIYRANRLVNWCCKLRTAISDIEVDYIDIDKRKKMKVPGHEKSYDFGILFEFAYKVVGTNDEIVVATTRPETMLGDTAVAVHSTDARYKHLHGKMLQHPLLDRQIPLITDDKLVDPNFGTGAVKVTPSHDPNDFECGKRNNLAFINIFNLDGTVNSNGGKFAGMMRYDARTAVMKALDEAKASRGIKDNVMRLAICSRSGDVIEPMVIPQWWAKCDTMAKEAADAVRNGEIQIFPESQKATWYQWLDNARDWCLSRQIVWGHRIPAYLVQLAGKPTADAAEDSNWIVARTEEEAKKKAEAKFKTKDFTLSRDPDVLDTWFSSGIFPFSVFGWPNQTADLEKFYPTTLLETGQDILFFWVARMVMMGKQLTGKWPFSQVLLHTMVRDAHGRKMSKSLGNTILPQQVIEGVTLEELQSILEEGNLDPKELETAKAGLKADFPMGISECGTDALRFGLCSYTSQGRDINLDIKRLEAYRNFCNKIWNAFKLSSSFLADNKYTPKATNALSGKESLSDKWILSRLEAAIKETLQGFKDYEFGKCTTALYGFWLYDYCDNYLEIIKSVMKGNDAAAKEAVCDTIYTCLDEILRLLHPFMPFITEELYQRLARRPGTNPPSICVAAYPAALAGRENALIEKDFAQLQVVIHAIRSLRSTYNLVKKMAAPVTINAHSKAHYDLYTRSTALIRDLSFSGEVTVTLDAKDAPAGSAVDVPDSTCNIYLVIKGLVDAQQELQKIQAKIQATEKQLAQLQAKMATADYAKKVPANVQESDKAKVLGLQNEIKTMNTAVETFKKLLA